MLASSGFKLSALKLASNYLGLQGPTAAQVLECRPVHHVWPKISHRSGFCNMRRPAVSRNQQQEEGGNPFESFAISAEKATPVDKKCTADGVVSSRRSSTRKAAVVTKEESSVPSTKEIMVGAEAHETATDMLQQTSKRKRSGGKVKKEAEVEACEVKDNLVAGGRGGERRGVIAVAGNGKMSGGSEASGELQLRGQMPIEKRQELLLSLADELVERLAPLKFRSPPVTCVYNPLVYAREPYEQYIRTCGGRPGVVMLIGMNPGPWGMAQTGIPFGDTVMVREFLKINGKVSTPEKLHPKRPVDGFSCPRREVSGSRLWGWARDRYGTADAFFSKFWVYNYCPLSFMESTGKNRTPDKLHPSERDAIISTCDAILARTIALIEPSYVIGLGKYAANRAKQCGIGSSFPVGDVLHPSPASPAANKDWAGTFESQLRTLGVQL